MVGQAGRGRLRSAGSDVKISASTFVDNASCDAARILAPGGRALFHHSNYQVPSTRHYGSHPHARNFMSQQLFFAYAREAQLDVERSEVLDWGGVAGSDCVSLLKKTSGEM